MTPTSIRRLRLDLWLLFWRESADFCLTLKYVKPEEGARPPYDFKPYWAFVNRIGRGPWWRFWKPWQEKRTLGPVQMFDSIEEAVKVARLQAFEVLHPEEAAEIAARERPVIPPAAPLPEHRFEWRMVTGGFVASCPCGWKGGHVADASGVDTESRFEFDVHLNEVTAKAREGSLNRPLCAYCNTFGDWAENLGPAFAHGRCASCRRDIATPIMAPKEIA